MQDILGPAVCSGLAGRAQPGEADCVLCPRQGGVGGGIQAQACLKWPPSWPGREHGPINRGHVWDPDGRAGVGTFKEGCLPPAPCPGNEEGPGVGGRRGCSPPPPAPVSVHEPLPTPRNGLPCSGLVHPTLLPGPHAWLRTGSLLLDGQGADTQLPPVSLPASTSGLPPHCLLLGPCLHPQTIITEQDYVSLKVSLPSQGYVHTHTHFLYPFIC